MVFAIGWSSVSIAAAKSMQIGMQMSHSSIQLQSSQDRAKQPSDRIEQHCLEPTLMSSSHHASTETSPPKNIEIDCWPSQMDMQSEQSHHCQECNLLLCQSLLVWLQQQPFDFQNNQLSTIAAVTVSQYHAQHLIGHWQEILRPPKA